MSNAMNESFVNESVGGSPEEDTIFGVKRDPDVDAQFVRDMERIREAERAVDLNQFVGGSPTPEETPQEPETAVLPVGQGKENR